MNKEIEVLGMTCNGCVRHVSKALEGIDGVDHVHVDLESGRAKITTHVDIADALLTQAVEAAGYRVK